MSSHGIRTVLWGLFLVMPQALLAAQEPGQPLSADARKLVADLELTRPVKIEAFISPDVPDDFVRAQRNLTAALEELDALGGETIRVRINRTERFSNEAVRAEQRFGITPRQITSPTRGGSRTDEIFMGVALTCGLESVILPFIDRGSSAEYELVRSLCTVAQQQRKRVGVLVTDARLYGGFDMRTMAATPNWPIIDELEKQYEVVQVDPADPITEKYDVLLAVQPSSLGPEPMDHFIDAVAGGQATVIFEDPFPVFAAGVPATAAPRRPPGRTNPMMMGQPPPPKGDIGRLWSLLGVDFAADQIVWQNYNPYPAMSTLPKEFVFVDTGSGAKQAFNPTDVVSAGIQHMLFPFPGLLAARNASDLEFTPLVRTGNENSGTVRFGEIIQMTPFGPMGGINPRRRQIPGNISYVLAAHVGGKPAADEEGGEAKRGPEINVVLVADIDMLHRQFFQLRERGDVPESGLHFDFDNVAFILNALDALAGDRRFLALRRRRGKHPVLARTPEQVAADRREAEARQPIQQEFDEAVRQEKQTLQKRLEELFERLKQQNIPQNELLHRIQVVRQIGQRRLDARIEQLTRKRDLEISRIGKKPVAEPPESAGETEDVRGQPLFPEFDDPLAAASLEIVEYDEELASLRAFRLAQIDGRWSIPSYKNYPTDARDRLVAALTGLLDLRVLEVAGENRQDHALYGVLDPGSDTLGAGATGVGTRVTIRDRHASVLLALILGKEVRGRPGLRYVRRVGQIPVYTVQVKTDALSTRFADWIDQDLLRLKPWEIRQIQIRDYSVDAVKGQLTQRSRMTLECSDVEGPRWRLVEHKVFQQRQWALEPLADDAELNTNRLDEVKHALADLRIVDVRRKPEGLAANLEADGTFGKEPESIRSLAARGFYLVAIQGKVELYAREGEIRVLLGDGVRYLLRFGEMAGAQIGTWGRKAGSEGAAGAGLNRYLLVTAEFDPGAIPKPELEPLPDEPGLAGGVRRRIERENARKQAEYEERIAEGRARSKELNDRFADWYYLISDALYRKIRLGRTDVMIGQEQQEDAGAPPEQSRFTPGDFDRLKREAPR